MQPEQRADHRGVNLRLNSKNELGKIYYTTNGKERTAKDQAYRDSIHVTKNAHIRAAVFIDGKRSGAEIDQELSVNKATGKPVKLAEKPAAKYNTGGAFTLVDGIWPEEAGEGSKWLG